MTAVANVRKGQTNMPQSGEHQTLTKQSMRHQLYPGVNITKICITKN